MTQSESEYEASFPPRAVEQKIRAGAGIERGACRRAVGEEALDVHARHGSHGGKLPADHDFSVRLDSDCGDKIGSDIGIEPRIQTSGHLRAQAGQEEKRKDEGKANRCQKKSGTDGRRGAGTRLHTPILIVSIINVLVWHKVKLK